ncbi:hypothetical protein QQF64_004558 [Cirrhinus molitorella]|uniref:Uncharacterized protein n=1 Tax=Cirrhinus molitorella TaxID=172907 RepID=A0ABR3MGK8_9TELE
MQSLKEIRKATTSMESKLSALMERISDVEARVEFLEAYDRDLQSNPPARKDEIDVLRDKLMDMEDRSRRNNLRFVGIPEGSEGTDMEAFLEETLPQLLNIPTPSHGWDIERVAQSSCPKTPTEREAPSGHCEIHALWDERPHSANIQREEAAAVEG